MKKIPLFLMTLVLISCSQIKKNTFFKNTSSNSSNGIEAYTMEYQKSTSYDFPDIPIPKELKLDPKKSLVFESATIKVGILVYKGRVDPLSLFEYFESNLPQNGWHLRSYFKYGKYIILFSKESKDLVIRIQDKGFTTETFIWVVPRTKSSINKSDEITEEEIKP
ncbi:hypothetical protein [Desulfothermus sp.]